MDSYKFKCKHGDNPHPSKNGYCQNPNDGSSYKGHPSHQEPHGHGRDVAHGTPPDQLYVKWEKTNQPLNYLSYTKGCMNKHHGLS